MAATYEYIGDGGLAFGGNAQTVWYKFHINDLVYTVDGANRGVLEKVCIKKVYLNWIFNEEVKSYQDTFNEIWIENELLTLVEAQAYIAMHT
jgi:hypothetical protein